MAQTLGPPGKPSLSSQTTADHTVLPLRTFWTQTLIDLPAVYRVLYVHTCMYMYVLHIYLYVFPARSF